MKSGIPKKKKNKKSRSLSQKMTCQISHINNLGEGGKNSQGFRPKDFEPKATQQNGCSEAYLKETSAQKISEKLLGKTTPK
jgi:hypothetical protein